MARRTISLEELDRLGIDPESGKLFWDDKEVVTAMSIPWWIQWAALLAAAAALISAFADVVAAFK